MSDLVFLRVVAGAAILIAGLYLVASSYEGGLPWEGRARNSRRVAVGWVVVVIGLAILFAWPGEAAELTEEGPDS